MTQRENPAPASEEPAKIAGEARALHILFRVAEAEYAVPAKDVLLMESFAGATKVPGSPSYVRGLVQIRGRVIPVIDVRARFGLPPVESTLDSRIVVVSEGERTVGLLVDSAREVAQIVPSAFRQPPEVLMGQSDGFVKAVAKAGDRLLMLVDFQRIIGEERINGD